MVLALKLRAILCHLQRLQVFLSSYLKTVARMLLSCYGLQTPRQLVSIQLLEPEAVETCHLIGRSGVRQAGLAQRMASALLEARATAVVTTSGYRLGLLGSSTSRFLARALLVNS